MKSSLLTTSRTERSVPPKTVDFASVPQRLIVGCPRREFCEGLCRTHYAAWRRASREAPSLKLSKWLATGQFAIPTDALPPCAVPECPRDAYYSERTLCELHHGRYHNGPRTLAPREWAKSETAYVGSYEFGLAHLDVQLRWEFLYGLQQRVARGGRIDPRPIRAATDVMRKIPSFSTMPEAEALQVIERSKEAGTSSLLAEIARALRRGHDDMMGVEPHERLVWDLVEVGALADPSVRGGTRRRKGLDFGQITQPWLRVATMDKCRELMVGPAINPLYKSVVIASHVLDQRADRGMDMSALGFRDADDIADAFRSLKRRDEAPCASAYKRALYLKFFVMIADSRRRGLLDELPSSFGRDRSHAVPMDFTAGIEEYGKSLPLEIVAQLDANLDQFGVRIPYKGLTDRQRHLMLSTIYLLIRDTGRRPKEIASLKRDYLTKDHNGPILIYDNHKAGRLKRRLPITESTADIVKRWIRVRNRLKNVHPASDEYLFPGHTAWQSYISTTKLASAFRTWIDSLDRLDTAETDQDGNTIAFDRRKVTARALRHTYAQRHADNGTPVDVLRVLMDHTSIQTTGLYYVVTTDRKREAIKTVGKYTIDRTGTARPLTEGTRYQMRAVAVPFGNCTEPSNVKSGGNSCPIRFQCAGCGFYRPDPSYIPAIEQHLNTLRGDRETALAIDVAPYVLDNLNAQIASFEEVLALMRRRLEGLNAAEREAIDDASAVLRKMRAAASLPLEDISRMPREADDD